MLTIRNLDVAYGAVTVLRRVSLHVNAGQIVAIVGANGAGKTTLLKAVTGLVRTRGGEIAPTSIFKSVVFPAPFEPTSPMRSCGPMRNETSSNR